MVLLPIAQLKVTCGRAATPRCLTASGSSGGGDAQTRRGTFWSLECLYLEAIKSRLLFLKTADTTTCSKTLFASVGAVLPFQRVLFY